MEIPRNPHTHSAAPCLPILSPFLRAGAVHHVSRRCCSLQASRTLQSSFFSVQSSTAVVPSPYPSNANRRSRTRASAVAPSPFPRNAVRRSRTRASAVTHSHPSPSDLVAVPARPSVPAPSNSQPGTPSIKSATASTRPES
ncbi:hypothetical protein PIB30_029633 [Stylosanthes scabra]|uniref:Uncharacterized protein n=1 Tax=Stylosanthes scabra TaxID=79078 RepID=A0ABU6RBW7_9FABA|nr:hypothetical protein [Stylosanthes scabra]